MNWLRRWLKRRKSYTLYSYHDPRYREYRTSWSWRWFRRETHRTRQTLPPDSERRKRAVSRRLNKKGGDQA